MVTPSLSISATFQSTPPSTGGDTLEPVRMLIHPITQFRFQSTPPSTGGDTWSTTCRRSGTRTRFNPRRLQQAATPATGTCGPNAELRVSIHAAFNRRRHEWRRVPRLARALVSIHAAFNRRRHVGHHAGVQRTTGYVSIHAAFNRRRHKEETGDFPRMQIPFQSTPPSTGGDTGRAGRRANQGQAVSIHAAFNRRRHHSSTRWRTLRVPASFQSTPPSTGGRHILQVHQV